MNRGGNSSLAIWQSGSLAVSGSLETFWLVWGQIRDCGDIPVSVGKIEKLGCPREGVDLRAELELCTHITESVGPIKKKGPIRLFLILSRCIYGYLIG